MLGIARQATFRALAATRADDSVLADVHAAIELPQRVVDWLARLAMLNDVPLAYLVSDPALLPPESIRFFCLDRDWLTALIEGACSVGRACSSDADDDAHLVARLRDAALAALPSAASGFVLRSAVLVGWPKLQVVAYASDVQLAALRCEIIAPGILLFIAAGTLSRVDLHEPAEGLHFGVSHDTHTQKSLRDLTDGTATTNIKRVTYRDAGERVMRVSDFADGIATGSASFALQLVQGVQSWRFDLE